MRLRLCLALSSALPFFAACSSTDNGSNGGAGAASGASIPSSGVAASGSNESPGSTGVAATGASGGVTGTQSGTTGSPASGASGSAAGADTSTNSGVSGGSTGEASGLPTDDVEGGVSGGTQADVDAGTGAGEADAASATTKTFPMCRFHYGAIDSTAKAGGASLISQLDMFTSGWVGSGTGVATTVCGETNSGGAFAGKVPALVSYIIAFTGRNAPGWCLADCNAGNAGCSPASDLCTKGADYIRQNFTSRILPQYETQAQTFAKLCGTNRPLIWEMEPDYYQYYSAGQGGGTRGQAGGPLSGAEAGNYMSQMIAAVKKYLPSAVFSMDTSPWMSNNGCAGSNSASSPGWYPFFDMTQFTFVNTSGGGTLANSPNIRTNEATWAGIHKCSGKPILADTGYGANGNSAGPDPNWDMASNINSRIVDGVISITQYNPNTGSWGSTISATRPSLNPVSCY